MRNTFQKLGYNVGDDSNHPDFQAALRPFAEITAQELLPCTSDYIRLYSQAWSAILESWKELVLRYKTKPNLKSVIDAAESKLMEHSIHSESENVYLTLIKQTLESHFGLDAEAIVI